MSRSTVIRTKTNFLYTGRINRNTKSASIYSPKPVQAYVNPLRGLLHWVLQSVKEQSCRRVMLAYGCAYNDEFYYCSAPGYHDLQQMRRCERTLRLTVYHMLHHIVALGRSRCMEMGRLCYVGQGGY
jgi:hypothetical protein